MQIEDRTSAVPGLALTLALVLTFAFVAVAPVAGAVAQEAESADAPTGPPAGVADLAATLPPLPRTGDDLALPLGVGDEAMPFAWRPVREGVSLRAGDGGLGAAYRVVTGQPAGAALVVRPGTFAGIDGLRIRAGANRNAQLLVTLQDATGAVYTLPAVALRVGTPREHERFLDEATYFPPQSTAPNSGGLDPAEVVMITLLDISGFMGADTPEVEWTVEAIEGVVR